VRRVDALLRQVGQPGRLPIFRLQIPASGQRSNAPSTKRAPFPLPRLLTPNDRRCCVLVMHAHDPAYQERNITAFKLLSSTTVASAAQESGAKTGIGSGKRYTDEMHAAVKEFLLNHIVRAGFCVESASKIVSRKLMYQSRLAIPKDAEGEYLLAALDTDSKGPERRGLSLGPFSAQLEPLCP
jgi:hypothetical protein